MTDPKRGGAISVFQIFQSDNLNHKTSYIADVMKDECTQLMQDFFRTLRKEPAT